MAGSALTGTLVGTLRVNLRIRGVKFLGARGWVAAKLCTLAALILGGSMIVEPEIETDVRPA